MEFKINSRMYGPQKFIVNIDGGYVYLWDTKEKEHRQICKGGGFTGSTLTADQKSLAKVARAWWRDYLKKQQLTFGVF